MKPPTKNESFTIPTGELTEPVVLTRSSRAPTGDADFLQTLTPYANAWAKMELAEQSFVDKKGTDPSATHFFWIRDLRLSIEASDYLRHGNDLYAVLGVKPMGREPAFLRLKVAYHKQVNDATLADDNITVNPDPSDLDNEVERTNTNPFWFPPPAP